MNCQVNAQRPRRAQRSLLWLALALGSQSAPGRASSSVELRCDALSGERAAAFEARAHAELLVRGEDGTVRLSCPPGTLQWRPSSGPPRSAPVAALDTETLLAALQGLLQSPKEPSVPATPTEAPTTRPKDGEPPPPPQGHRGAVGAAFPVLRVGGAARSWGATGALGAMLGAGLSLESLTLGVSGHSSRGLLSYEGVSLYVLEARVGAELTRFDAVHFGVAAGLGRPFTLEPGDVRAVAANDDLWFVEGVARAAVPLRLSRAFRLELGAEVALFSRPIRLRVNDTLGYDFGFQPGVFVETALELH